MESTEVIVLIVVLVVFIVLITQRWFWLLVFGLSFLASAFACIASVIHFQILAAVGFFVLAYVLNIMFAAINQY